MTYILIYIIDPIDPIDSISGFILLQPSQPPRDLSKKSSMVKDKGSNVKVFRVTFISWAKNKTGGFGDSIFCKKKHIPILYHHISIWIMDL